MLGGAAMLAALAAPAVAEAKVSDVLILNFGLRFERLQATFYTEADELGTIGRMSNVKRVWGETLGAHERAHVRIFKQALGRKAGARPTFDFGDATETDAAFTRTAVAMEDLTVALLTGVAPLVRWTSARSTWNTILWCATVERPRGVARRSLATPRMSRRRHRAEAQRAASVLRQPEYGPYQPP